MAKKTKQTKQTGQSTSPAPVRGVDLAEVERLLEFMQKHRLEQFEYERDGVHLLLKKESSQPRTELRSTGLTETRQVELAVEPTVPPPSSSVPTGTPAVERGAADDLHVIKSPIVGTFYASASPGVEPFVTVGGRVDAGQVLCIIEAMKLMNEIESDMAGEVAKIFPENGNPVEYGEPLFGIRPNRKK